MSLRAFEHRAGTLTTFSTELATPSPIHFGFGIAARLAETITRATADDPVDRIFVFTDRAVFDRFGDELFDPLAKRWSHTKIHLLPDGEASKTFTHLERACQRVVEQGATKKSLVVSLGGGSVGNVAGLVAGLTFRGIRFVEVPTTFTHQTDGTLSNKQAINGGSGKNHFGVYHAPLFIWTDTAYLRTEPKRVKQAGIVEGIKNALIQETAFIDTLRARLRSDCEYSDAELTELALATIRSKLGILRRDPGEKHYGLVLEYGHTFAHAIEWLAAGKLIHGECVALGMRIAARLAARIGLIDPDLVALHDELIDEQLGLRPQIPDDIDACTVVSAMRADNKRTASVVRYVLLERCGACSNREGDYLVTVEDEIVTEVLAAFLDTYRAGFERETRSSSCNDRLHTSFLQALYESQRAQTDKPATESSS